MRDRTVQPHIDNVPAAPCSRRRSVAVAVAAPSARSTTPADERSGPGEAGRGHGGEQGKERGERGEGAAGECDAARMSAWTRAPALKARNGPRGDGGQCAASALEAPLTRPEPEIQPAA